MVTLAFKTFWSRQVRQIREEGWAALQRKMKVLIMNLTFILVILMIRVLRPLILIRFGPVRSDVIGHNVFDPEYYLSERELERDTSIDCFYFRSKTPPNEQWSLMIRRHLLVNRIFFYLDRVNKWIPGWQVHHKVAGVQGSRDLKGYLAQTKPHITFTSEENNRGRLFLEKLGLRVSDRFVCLIVRDFAYKENYQKWGNRDWSYHNYRDSDIDTYEQAALALAEKGYWVFRMGKAVRKPFKADHSRIMDYANSEYRSDFLDIWLMANCFFCVSTGTGLDEVTRIFRKPAVYVNYLPISDIVSYSHCISVPKHLFNQKKNRRLTLSEHLIHSYYHTEKYENAKILVENLTAEEIRQAVLEMESKLDGSWQQSDEDKQLQERFWQIFESHPDFEKYHGKIHPKARVGAHFLRNNPEWLN